MRPLPFVWPWWPVYWAVFVWAFYPELRIIREATARAKGVRSQDAGSLGVILVGMQFAMFIAYPLAWIPALRMPATWQVPALVTGALLLIAGSLLRRHCWKMLGASFTGDVRARPDQSVVTAGAYQWLRHPSYTGGILMNIAIGVALGSWGSVVLLAVSSFAVYSYRITVEERALSGAIGEPYREFMRTRRRLVPFIY